MSVTFLGEFTDCLLPAKKLMGTKNHDFMDSKRDAFEQYLQVSWGQIINCNCAADQRLCFRYTDSTIPLLPKSEISSL